MKTEEAIINIKWTMQNKSHNKELCLLCIEALEKQLPKKPIKHSGKDDTKDFLACCPICDGCVDWTYNGFWRKGNPQYCKECGQKIDWS